MIDYKLTVHNIIDNVRDTTYFTRNPSLLYYKFPFITVFLAVTLKQKKSVVFMFKIVVSR